MKTDLSKSLGPTQFKKLTAARPRQAGPINDLMNGVEVLTGLHAELLQKVWANLPFHAQTDAEIQILELGEAAQAVKMAARALIRGGKND